MTANDALTPAHAKVRRRLERLKVRHDRATATLQAIEDERAALYVEARELQPALTYKAIADIFDVTEAAIIQKVNRERERLAREAAT